jgi:short-subunit dehydrogenase
MSNEPTVGQKHAKTFILTGGSDELGTAFGHRCGKAEYQVINLSRARSIPS